MSNIYIPQLPQLTSPQFSGETIYDNGTTTYKMSLQTLTDFLIEKINNKNLIDVTYSELVSDIAGSTLKPGYYYNITDFRTCYDLPDFYVNGSSKYGSNIRYVSGSTIEPIIVLSTSENTIDENAYQPLHPKDKIKYDWTWSHTEITSGQAYGRITERIDEFNNRTDYDHRNIQFIRYQSYDKGSQLTGTTTSYNCTTGELIGNGTLFLTEVSIGDVLIFDYDGSEIGVKVVSAITNTTLSVVIDTGYTQTNFSGQNFITYNTNSTENYYDYKEVYVGQNTLLDYDTFLTFRLTGNAYNNYIGDYSYLYLGELNSNGFLLSNNVFLSWQPVYSNKIGYGSYSNTIYQNFYKNTIGDDFYKNISKDYFVENTIDGQFYNNTINSYFGENTIGIYFYDNTINSNFVENTIDQEFYNNTTNSDFYNNTIGIYFNNNTINSSFYENTIDQEFYNNTIYSNFYKNTIDKYFKNNTIYSEFYENKIGLNLENNTIGDNGNLGNFNFYRNRIGNKFRNNTVRKDFQNNQIGNEFNNNTTNGDFYKNVIGNGFNYNQNIGYNFYGNHIGNGFNNNELIGDYFQDNTIGEYFNNNSISYLFKNNQINNGFQMNTLGNTDYFNWDTTSIQNLTGRTYNTFYNSLYGDGGENIGNVILGKELIMHFSRNSGTTFTNEDLIIGETYEITNYTNGGDFSNVADVISGEINTNGCIFIATGITPINYCGTTLTELTSYDEYHKVKFTQWTQSSNGGGFSYERTKVYPTSESTVYFTKLNYGSEIDVIIQGRLEIKRNNGGAIYNAVVEGNFNSNYSPQGTEWNSIYTQSYNGSSFLDNKIGNDFKSNYIFGEFQLNIVGSHVGDGNHFSGNTYSNIMGHFTFNNDFLGSISKNNWGSGFYYNTIGNDFNDNFIGGIFYDNTMGENFYRNNIQNDFNYNTIGNGFQTNEIGNYFNNNTIDDNFGFGYSDPQGNKIGNNFHNNTIGEYFYNNSIPDNFYSNEIGNYFQWNVINTNIDNTDFTLNYGNILGFSYVSTGNTAGNSLTTNVTTITTGNGISAKFTITSDSGTIVGVDLTNCGKFYLVNDTITILGTQIGGVTGVVNGFTSNGIGKSGTTGSYTNLYATGVSNGENLSFDVNVTDNIVDSVLLNTGGGSYSVGDTLKIVGSLFGGVNNVDDITITVNSLYSDDIVITVTGTSETPVFYEHHTKQMFEIKGGNKRVSYYDKDDVLNLDPVGVSFTINSSDFSNGSGIYLDTTPLGVNGTIGFENTVSQNDLYQGFNGVGLNGNSLSQINAAYNTLGFNTNDSVGRIWYVTWGVGSSLFSGFVKFGCNVNGLFFDIQTIDTSNPNYLTNNGDGTSLVGTFKFPATFTIYKPIINKTGWC